jgi:ATP-dependent Lon protease
VIPHENEKDLKEVPKNIKESLNIVPVKWIDEVLDVALAYAPEMGVEEKKSQKDEAKGSSERINTH